MRTLTYRGQLLIYTLASLLSVVAIVAVWLNSDFVSVGGYTRSELISYYLVGLFFQRLVYSSLINYYVQEIVSDGSIVGLFLTKPVSFLWAVFGLEVGWFVVAALIGFLVVVCFSVLIGTGVVFHLTAVSFVIALVALLFALMLVFLSSFLMGLISLWTVQISSFVSLYWIALMFFGGIMLPLTFFPAFLREAVYLNPFRFMFSFPLEIILGKINFIDSINGLFIQIVWGAIFIFAYYFMWRKGSRVYSGYGQ